MENKLLKRSPFFYVGDKFNLLQEITQYFPKKIIYAGLGLWLFGI